MKHFYPLMLLLGLGSLYQDIYAQEHLTYRHVITQALSSAQLRQELAFDWQQPLAVNCLYTNGLIPAKGKVYIGEVPVPLRYGKPINGLQSSQAMLLKLTIRPGVSKLRFAFGPEMKIKVRMRAADKRWETDRMFIKATRARSRKFRWYW